MSTKSCLKKVDPNKTIRVTSFIRFYCYWSVSRIISVVSFKAHCETPRLPLLSSFQFIAELPEF